MSKKNSKKVSVFSSICFLTESQHDMLHNEETVIEKTKEEEIEIAKKIVSESLNINEEEMEIFLAVFAVNLVSNILPSQKGSFDSIAEELNISQMKLLEKSDILDSLVKKDILDCHNFPDETENNPLNNYYLINNLVTHQLNLEKEQNKSKKKMSSYSFIEEMSFLYKYKSKSNIKLNTFDKKIRLLENRYGKSEFIKTIKKKVPYIYDRILFYYLCISHMEIQSCMRISLLVKWIHTDINERMSQWNGIVEGTSSLVKENLIALEEDEKDWAELSEEGEKLFMKDHTKLFETINFGSNETEYNKKEETEEKETEKSDEKFYKLVRPDDIQKKELFYNESDRKQIESLFEIFREEKLNSLKSELKSHNMNTGISTVLYGGPGTGKTELVLQVAKSTGRPVMMVEISSLRVKWFGQSERLVSSLFDDYEKYCETEAVTPILLFNEADAVFQKRNERDNGDRGTENRIQNILLDKLEKFKGISISTTNLINNMDRAYERRFLFKVNVNSPEKETRKKIWKCRLENMKEEEYEFLASKYKFSGGEIENVVKKWIIEKVISGNSSFDNLKAICDNEKIVNQRNAVGF